MASAATGAVFFLGTRAHYQALQPPDSAQYDVENGNEPAECGWIHCTRSERSGSDLLLLEYRCEETVAPGTSGVTRRFRGKRAPDGTNERIITDDGDSEGYRNINYRDSIKSKESAASGRCASLRALLASLRSRRKRRLSLERGRGPGAGAALPPACTYRDSCRCLDCQSRYFECDESDSDCSVSSGNYNDYSHSDYDYEELERAPFPAASSPRPHDPRDTGDTYDTYDENEEVFADAPPGPDSAELLVAGDADADAPVKMSVSSDEVTDGESPLELEMAAGTPVVLDYLLNHPITCCVQ